ncbi:uncharacterized protein LOC142361431 isoform X4 [Opisthocomus hoazin]|uniref:uncharacterized protein LOC142361431 isoform X4 n=1 Tax=Opisthocomus hoazin TaxID=30419 RepID=UPI003F52B015
MSVPQQGFLATYNSLMDKHLIGYFNNTRIREHLQRSGLISRSGRIISEKEYRLNVRRKDHEIYVQQCLALAIYHKVLDMERHHQLEMRRKLESSVRKKREQKIKVDQSRRSVEGASPVRFPHLGPRKCYDLHRLVAGEPASASQLRAPGPVVDYNDGHPSHQQQSKEPAISKTTSWQQNTAPGTMQHPLRLLRLRSCAAVESAPKTSSSKQKCHTLEHEQRFPSGGKKSGLRLKDSVKHATGISPYQIPIVNSSMIPVPPPPRQGGDKSVNAVRSGMHRGRRLRPMTVPNDTEQILRKNSEELPKPLLHSNALVTMVFLRKCGRLSHGDTDYRDEIKVYQRQGGGENLCVYRGKLLEGETFQFTSKRPHGFPFCLIFFLNGMQVDRFSCCCEYKHQKLSRLEDRHEYFAFLSAEGASPCYRCIIAMGLDKKPSPPKRKMEDHEEKHVGSWRDGVRRKPTKNSAERKSRKDSTLVILPGHEASVETIEDKMETGQEYRKEERKKISDHASEDRQEDTRKNDQRSARSLSSAGTPCSSEDDSDGEMEKDGVMGKEEYDIEKASDNAARAQYRNEHGENKPLRMEENQETFALEEEGIDEAEKAESEDLTVGEGTGIFHENIMRRQHQSPAVNGELKQTGSVESAVREDGEKNASIRSDAGEESLLVPLESNTMEAEDSDEESAQGDGGGVFEDCKPVQKETAKADGDDRHVNSEPEPIDSCVGEEEENITSTERDANEDQRSARSLSSAGTPCSSEDDSDGEMEKDGVMGKEEYDIEKASDNAARAQYRNEHGENKPLRMEENQETFALEEEGIDEAEKAESEDLTVGEGTGIFHENIMRRQHQSPAVNGELKQTGSVESAVREDGEKNASIRSDAGEESLLVPLESNTMEAEDSDEESAQGDGGGVFEDCKPVQKETAKADGDDRHVNSEPEPIDSCVGEEEENITSTERDANEDQRSARSLSSAGTPCSSEDDSDGEMEKDGVMGKEEYDIEKASDNAARAQYGNEHGENKPLRMEENQETFAPEEEGIDEAEKAESEDLTVGEGTGIFHENIMRRQHQSPAVNGELKQTGSVESAVREDGEKNASIRSDAGEESLLVPLESNTMEAEDSDEESAQGDGGGVFEDCKPVQKETAKADGDDRHVNSEPEPIDSCVGEEEENITSTERDANEDQRSARSLSSAGTPCSSEDDSDGEMEKDGVMGKEEYDIEKASDNAARAQYGNEHGENKPLRMEENQETFAPEEEGIDEAEKAESEDLTVGEGTGIFHENIMRRQHQSPAVNGELKQTGSVESAVREDGEKNASIRSDAGEESLLVPLESNTMEAEDSDEESAQGDGGGVFEDCKPVQKETAKADGDDRHVNSEPEPIDSCVGEEEENITSTERDANEDQRSARSLSSAGTPCSSEDDSDGEMEKDGVMGKEEYDIEKASDNAARAQYGNEHGENKPLRMEENQETFAPEEEGIDEAEKAESEDLTVGEGTGIFHENIMRRQHQSPAVNGELKQTGSVESAVREDGEKNASIRSDAGEESLLVPLESNTMEAEDSDEESAQGDGGGVFEDCKPVQKETAKADGDDRHVNSEPEPIDSCVGEEEENITSTERDANEDQRSVRSLSSAGTPCSSEDDSDGEMEKDGVMGKEEYDIEKASDNAARAQYGNEHGENKPLRMEENQETFAPEEEGIDEAEKAESEDLTVGEGTGIFHENIMRRQHQSPAVNGELKQTGSVESAVREDGEKNASIRSDAGEESLLVPLESNTMEAEDSDEESAQGDGGGVFEDCKPVQKETAKADGDDRHVNSEPEPIDSCVGEEEENITSTERDANEDQRSARSLSSAGTPCSSEDDSDGEMEKDGVMGKEEYDIEKASDNAARAQYGNEHGENKPLRMEENQETFAPEEEGIDEAEKAESEDLTVGEGTGIFHENIMRRQHQSPAVNGELKQTGSVESAVREDGEKNASIRSDAGEESLLVPLESNTMEAEDSDEESAQGDGGGVFEDCKPVQKETAKADGDDRHVNSEPEPIDSCVGEEEENITSTERDANEDQRSARSLSSAGTPCSSEDDSDGEMEKDGVMGKEEYDIEKASDNAARAQYGNEHGENKPLRMEENQETFAPEEEGIDEAEKAESEDLTVGEGTGIFHENIMRRQHQSPAVNGELKQTGSVESAVREDGEKNASIRSDAGEESLLVPLESNTMEAEDSDEESAQGDGGGVFEDCKPVQKETAKADGDDRHVNSEPEPIDSCVGEEEENITSTERDANEDQRSARSLSSAGTPCSSEDDSDGEMEKDGVMGKEEYDIEKASDNAARAQYGNEHGENKPLRMEENQETFAPEEEGIDEAEKAESEDLTVGEGTGIFHENIMRRQHQSPAVNGELKQTGSVESAVREDGEKNASIRSDAGEESLLVPLESNTMEAEDSDEESAQGDGGGVFEDCKPVQKETAKADGDDRHVNSEPEPIDSCVGEEEENITSTERDANEVPVTFIPARTKTTRVPGVPRSQRSRVAWQCHVSSQLDGALRRARRDGAVPRHSTALHGCATARSMHVDRKDHPSSEVLGAHAQGQQPRVAGSAR